MEFKIPFKREDLLNGSSLGQYVVENLLTIREINHRWNEYNEAANEQRSAFILEYFDAIYSCVCQFNALDIAKRHGCWFMINKALCNFQDEMHFALEENELDDETRLRYLNILKMLTYLYCQMIGEFEKELTDSQALTIAKGSKKATGKSNKSKQAEWNWEDERLKAFQNLRQFFDLDIKQLWDPPLVEEEFLSLVTSCCYKAMESTSISRANELKIAVFHILGHCLRIQKNVVGCAVKIIQLLQLFEHVAIPLAQAVVVFVQEYSVTTILYEIIREIGNFTGMNDGSSDVGGAKAFSLFLVEVSKHLPDLILTNISLLVSHLNGEIYAMRNCVLGIMCDILLNALNHDEISEKQRFLRDQFLEHLEDHIHDVNAFVRSRTMQLWVKLFESKVVPIARNEAILSYVIGRLEDKSCVVRKSAMQLLTAILHSNPFASKLSLEELEKNYEKEKKKLHEMNPTLVNENSLNDDLPDWTTIEDELKKLIYTALKNVMTSKESSEEAMLKCPKTELRQEDIVKIRTLLHSEDYNTAVDALTTDYEIGANIDSESINISEAGIRILTTLKQAFHAKSVIIQSDEIHVTEPAIADNRHSADELMKQKVLVNYLKDSVRFAKRISQSMPLICQLLGSKQSSDVLQAIEFFVTAFEFGVHNSYVGVKKSLTLIWSKVTAIRDAVIGAYKRLYLDNVPDNKNRADWIADNLTMLTKHATLGEMVSLEELVRELVLQKELDNSVINVLWNRFSQQDSQEKAHAAIVLLGMAGNARPEVIQNNLALLVNVGLGECAQKDLKFAKDNFLALLKASNNDKPSVEAKEAPMRMPHDHAIFCRIADIITTCVGRSKDCMWTSMMEAGIQLIYRLAENPDVICDGILMKLLKRCSETEDPKCCVMVLARFISCCGQVASFQMNHLDVYVNCELKRRKFIEESERNEAKTKTLKRKSKRSVNVSASMNKDSETAADDELEMFGAVADDAEADFIRTVCEDEIVTGENLLARIAPVICKIASDPIKYSSQELQAAATLALSKFMLVSSVFCENNLQLLFTILEKSSVPIVRANIMVTLGDLACRFPNTVEPWTPHLYKKLHDSDFEVRRNTLIVLTHLILHDMIKVKGQISDMALCTIDKDTRISGQARLFFSHLAEKGNALYNVLPDIISRLSDDEVGTTEENFREILKDLLAYIDKDRLQENMVEKLCLRFRTAGSERQWRNIGFCLSKVCSTEKGCHKLLDNISCYSDKLFEPQVHEYLCSIIENVRKSSKKTDNKTVVDELEQKIEEFFQKGTEEQSIADRATKIVSNRLQTAASVRKQRKEQKMKSKLRNSPERETRKRISKLRDDSITDDENFESPENVVSVRRTTRQSTRKRRALSISSDEEF